MYENNLQKVSWSEAIQPHQHSSLSVPKQAWHRSSRVYARVIIDTQTIVEYKEKKWKGIGKWGGVKWIKDSEVDGVGTVGTGYDYWVAGTCCFVATWGFGSAGG